MAAIRAGRDDRADVISSDGALRESRQVRGPGHTTRPAFLTHPHPAAGSQDKQGCQGLKKGFKSKVVLAAFLIWVNTSKAIGSQLDSHLVTSPEH